MAERTPVDERSLTLGAPTAWAQARERLETPERDRVYWLATIRPGGQAHVRPILGLWLDDAFYFITGETTRKGRNLAVDPRCVMTASSHALPALDVMAQGDAAQVTDQTKVRRVADAYASTLQWPLEIRDGGVFGPNAPTAGPPLTRCSNSRPRLCSGCRASPGPR